MGCTHQLPSHPAQEDLREPFDEVLQEEEVLAAVDRGQGAQLLTKKR